MAASSVRLEGDAFMVCLIHALSTEREEVMGLLIGEVIVSFCGQMLLLMLKTLI